MSEPGLYTKIVATVGPASNTYEIIRTLIIEGVRIIRLNFSHGSYDEQQARHDMARKASAALAIPLAIVQDLQGPKIRVGSLAEPSFEIKGGDKLTITTEQCMGTKDRISIDYPYLHEEVSKGSQIRIDDGLISLTVDSVVGKDILCTIAEDGTLFPRKGVNLPGIPLHHLSSFTEKDKKDLAFAFANKLDYVALSFVRSSKDIIALKAYMQKTFGRVIPIIAKIEKPEAVADIDAIIEHSSAIMVARGDLGVEALPEEVPLFQKSIIRKCLAAGVPVITATQMLDSMMHNPRPTRAETNDVANAVLDGTSAVMLSGETAAGEYPIQAVKTMKRIAALTERSDEFKRLVLNQIHDLEHGKLEKKQTKTEAVGIATRELALAIQASFIACFTHSGSTARLIAKFRPSVPILAFSPKIETVQRLSLSWGVNPILIQDLSSVDQLLDYAPHYLQEKGFVSKGETVVITAGVPVGSSGRTNMIKVVEIE
ncbi:pyruvate kinase [uncultured Sphaerochaeta sp.]|uniref:pyruvate kinase n=1 Tax=uncultured Sphaerochaeta sp. TaxID=886478 RepID=UPI002A0A1E31|nr:pyruvate kinase [uncultured Sphaerochaeta sp.]